MVSRPNLQGNPLVIELKLQSLVITQTSMKSGLSHWPYRPGQRQQSIIDLGQILVAHVLGRKNQSHDSAYEVIKFDSRRRSVLYVSLGDCSGKENRQSAQDVLYTSDKSPILVAHVLGRKNYRQSHQSVYEVLQFDSRRRSVFCVIWAIAVGKKTGSRHKTIIINF